MNRPEDQTQDLWKLATYDGLERQQLLDGMKMSFAQKLKWLEETQQLAESFKAAGEAQHTAKKRAAG